MSTSRLLAAALAATVISTPIFAQELETDMDRLSYTVGMDIGNSLSEQGLELDLDLLVEALRASYNGEETLLTREEALAERDKFMQRRQQELEAQRNVDAQRNLEEGQAFLAQNAERDGVVVTESGLQYRVITEGEGASPVATDTVTVHYRGTLLNGTEFDSSYSRDQPATFALDQVIPGWTEGVQLMKEGSKYEFFIPADLAYGEQGRPGPIGPNSTLIFEVELLEVAGSGD
jgi:FKBP-type peptidyl-prolyl cis-trans isomerase